MKKNFLPTLLAALMLLLFTAGCENSDVMRISDSHRSKRPELPEMIPQEDAIQLCDFSLRILRENASESENTLISPFSLLNALGITAVGADGKTLTQMETTIGISSDNLNRDMAVWRNSLKNTSKASLHSANSIWITDDDRVTVYDSFLQTNADYWKADIFRIPFDGKAHRTINAWAEDNTEGKIKDILDKVNSDAVMYLVNALAFDAEWADIYESTQVQKAAFKCSDGATAKIKMMYGSDSVYLEDENASGFMKYYKGHNYAFAALLPREDSDINEYLQNVDGMTLYTMLHSPQRCTVNTGIPKFSSTYTAEMSPIFASMGMSDAFDFDKADFSRLGISSAGNIAISRILHKTTITVDERGTEAGAVTVIEMADGASDIIEVKQVILNRPFIYMLLDTENCIPVFIGIMNNPAES